MANDLFLLLAQIEALEIELLLATAQQTQTDRLAVDCWNCRDAYVDLLIVRVQIHASVLRETPFRDVHMRHYL